MRREFELSYFEAAAQHVIHYATGDLPEPFGYCIIINRAFAFYTTNIFSCFFGPSSNS